MSEVPLSYQETVGKRGVGVLVDECRKTIEEHNYQRSQSPYRPSEMEYDRVSSAMNEGNGYASVSARNIEIVNAPRQDAQGYL